MLWLLASVRVGPIVFGVLGSVSAELMAFRSVSVEVIAFGVRQCRRDGVWDGSVSKVWCLGADSNEVIEFGVSQRRPSIRVDSIVS